MSFLSSNFSGLQMFHLQSTRPRPLHLCIKTRSRTTYLLPIFVCVSTRPEEVCTGAHSSALVGFLQEFGRSKCTLSPQGFVILFTEALHPLESANDQGDGSQLCFGITDFILIQRKRLVGHKTLLGTNHARQHFPQSIQPSP